MLTIEEKEKQRRAKIINPENLDIENVRKEHGIRIEPYKVKELGNEGGINEGKLINVTYYRIFDEITKKEIGYSKYFTDIVVLDENNILVEYFQGEHFKTDYGIRHLKRNLEDKRTNSYNPFTKAACFATNNSGSIEKINDNTVILSEFNKYFLYNYKKEKIISDSVDEKPEFKTMKDAKNKQAIVTINGRLGTVLDEKGKFRKNFIDLTDGYHWPTSAYDLTDVLLEIRRKDSEKPTKEEIQNNLIKDFNNRTKKEGN